MPLLAIFNCLCEAMITINDTATIYSAFMDAAGDAPDDDFLFVVAETAAVYSIDAGAISYREAARRIDALKERYQLAGYGDGDRVMLALENRPDYFWHWFALNALGAGVVPVNPDLRIAELQYMIEHAAPVLAVALGPKAKELGDAAKRAGVVLAVVSPDEAPPQRPAGGDSFGASTALRREAAMLYTSGTTGRPKGCVLSNLYFLHAGDWYQRTGGICGIERGERMITPLPLFHMNAMACSTMAMVAVRGCLTILDRFHPSTWWDSVRECDATALHYLGVMPTLLMNAPASVRDKEHKVRFGFGAGVMAELHAPFEERFGIPLMEAWAMTETGAGGCIAANHGVRKIGQSVFGRPEPQVEVLIVTDDGSEAAIDEPGELLVRYAGEDPGYGFFSEYHRDPQATAQAWSKGWFHTGDLVRCDADGDMVFVDRKKNVIRRSGENIAAVEVESVLLRHPDIDSIAVAAVPDAVRGDEVFACVVAGELGGAEKTAFAERIVRWCLGELAYYKAPGYVAFVEALPLTSTQKIQRGELKSLAHQLLKDGACIDTRHLKRRDVP
jgi:acyl-CoA synthetase (AMP-forming)/AMP-acid ligase II